MLISTSTNESLPHHMTRALSDEQSDSLRLRWEEEGERRGQADRGIEAEGATAETVTL